jgi:GDP-L-fucose synthase
MKVLLLGSTGFVGKAVKKHLKEHQVFSLSRRELEPMVARKIGCDLTDKMDFTLVLNAIKPDVIINCAAHAGSVHYAIRNPASMIYDNSMMLLNLYETVSHVSPHTKIINPISNCSYPGHTTIQKEEEWENGPVHASVKPFGVTRRLIYHLSDCYFKQHGIKSVNMIFPNSYGEGDSNDPDHTHALNGLIIRLLKAKKQGDMTFDIWGTGEPRREWIYVDDMACMLIKGMKVDSQVIPLNIAQNKSYSIKEIAVMVSDMIGYFPKFIFNTKFADGDMVKQLEDTKFRSIYPKFKFTELSEGIKNTIKYYA